MTARAIPFLPPVSDLLLWLDAADASTITTSGSTVTAWRDKSPLARHPTVQGTAPTFGSSVINGRPAITFVAGRFQGPLLAAGGGSNYTGSDLHAFAVVRPTDSVGNQRILSLGRSGSPGSVDWDSNTTLGMLHRGNGVSGSAIIVRESTQATSSTALTINQNWLIQSSSSATNVFVGVGGETPIMSSATPSAAAHNFNIYSVGQHTYTLDSNEHYRGSIGEVLLFGRQLNEGERVSVESYLARKWGLSSGAGVVSTHPVVTRPFTNVGRPLPYSAGFLPTSISGLAFWLDGADVNGNGVIPADGVSLASWADKSGNGRNPTQAAGGSQPIYSLRNRSVRFFSDRHFDVPQAAINNASEYDLFVVINPIANLNNIIVKQHNGVNTMCDLTTTRIFQSNGTSRHFYWRNENSGILLNSGFPVAAEYMLISVSASGTSASMRQNTTQIASATGNVTIPNSTGATNMKMGMWLADGSISQQGQTNFEMLEFLFYNRALTVNERQSIESYLANKWILEQRLPVAHPHFTAPAGRTVFAAPPPPSRIITTIVRFTIGNAIPDTDFRITRGPTGRVYYRFLTTGKTMTLTVNAPLLCEILCLGGGGGGNHGKWFSGGGGAGGLQLLTNHTLTPGTYNIVIGTGGNPGSAGGNTTFGGLLTALGGAAGTGNANGAAGGCGSGAGLNQSTGGTGSQGGNGGRGDTGGTGNSGGGGGGGVASVGSSGLGVGGNSRADGAGNGGQGISYDIGTQILQIGGGGGSRANNLGAGGVGTFGGGSGGSGGNQPATSGQPNTGGGGGSAWQILGSGGSGIVILSFQT